jgi:hypothetical protein
MYKYSKIFSKNSKSMLRTFCVLKFFSKQTNSHFRDPLDLSDPEGKLDPMELLAYLGSLVNEDCLDYQ